MILGREHEQHQLAEVIRGAYNGHSAALVLRGPAGIGKSTLLEDLAATAGAAVRVLRAVGVESEVELPFAGLHQILRPLLPGLERLPAPQAGALRAAFGLDSAPVDRFFVAMAGLTLLSHASTDTPLAVLVDDAHWLDPASTDALLFMARRLGAEGVAMIFAARSGTGRFDAPGIPELLLGPLPAPAAEELLSHTAPKAARVVAQRLLSESEGNPLALRELPTALAGEQLRGRAALPERLPLNVRLQQIYLERTAQLPGPRTNVLLLAAIESDGDLSTILAASTDREAATTDLYAAVTAQLITLQDHRVHFRHPLVRSALYQAATPTERHTAHRALAGALDPGDERRPWHLAAATIGTDDNVAHLLATLAERSHRAGALAAAARALRRAAALTTSPHTRAQWLIDAAAHTWEAADPSQAMALLDQAHPHATTPRLRARAARVRGAIIHASGNPALACRTLLDGARTLITPTTTQPDTTPDTETQTDASTTTSTATGTGTDADISTGAERAAGAGTTPIPVTGPGAGITSGADNDTDLADEMLVMAARSAWVASQPHQFTTINTLLEHTAPTSKIPPHFRTLLTYLASLDPNTHVPRPPRPNPNDHTTCITTWLATNNPRPWIWPPSFLSHLLGDTDTTHTAYHTAINTLRTNGTTGALPLALLPLISHQLTTGQWATATTTATQTLPTADETGQLAAAHLRAMLAWINAAQGNTDQCHHYADQALAIATSRHITSTIALTHWALGLNALTQGQPHQATHHLTPLTTPGHPAAHFMINWLVLPDLIEALHHTGQTQQAHTYLQYLTHHAQPHSHPTLHHTYLRTQALLAPHHQTQTLYTQALNTPTPNPFDTARTHLQYAQWLRRNRHIKTARTHLHHAHTHFQHTGATAWTHKTQQELRAAGHHPHHTPTPTTERLRPLGPTTPADPTTPTEPASHTRPVEPVAPLTAPTGPTTAGTTKPTAGLTRHQEATSPHTPTGIAEPTPTGPTGPHQHTPTPNYPTPQQPLTPREQQIIQLAAQGLTNNDIAQQLFLSPRTVGYHLYKAFPKLHITSRHQLTQQPEREYEHNNQQPE